MLVNLDRREDGIATVTLADPDRRNALSDELVDQLVETCASIAHDDDLRVVVLTGAPPAFSSGGLLENLENNSARAHDGNFNAEFHMRRFYDALLTVRQLPVPVIAVVNGHAIGAGLCLALACDLRIVAEEAKVGLTFARLGLFPGLGATWLLPRIVGDEQGAMMLYTGRLLTAHEAVRVGLALEAVPADQIMSHALSLAEEIATASPMVVRQLKRVLRMSPGLDFSSAIDVETREQALSFASSDLAEGLTAAREKRPPDFGRT
jgi:enoyl-CoA hydratase